MDFSDECTVIISEPFARCQMPGKAARVIGGIAKRSTSDTAAQRRNLLARNFAIARPKSEGIRLYLIGTHRAVV